MKHHNRREGNILFIALGVLLVGVTLVGIILSSTMTAARNTDRSREHMAAQSAAEGAMEYAYAVWYKRIQNKHGMLSTPSDLTVTGSNFGVSFTGTNSPKGSNGYEYTTSGTISIQPLNKYGVAVTGTTPDGVIGPVTGYPGWWGVTHIYAATATMRPVGNPSISVNVRRLFYYTEVSMFQTMFFFNDDLEIYNPAAMTIGGLLHSNGAMYISSANTLNILGNVTTAGDLPLYKPNGVDPKTGKTTYGTTPFTTPYVADFPSVKGFTTMEPPLALNSTADVGQQADPTWGNGGASKQLSQVPKIQSLGTALDDLFDADAQAATHNPNLVNGFHELVEAPDLSDIPNTKPDPIADKRLINKAGLIIRINGTTRSGTSNITVKNNKGTNSITYKPYTSADVGITTATVTTYTDVNTGAKTVETSLPTMTVNGATPTIIVAAANDATLPVYNPSLTLAQQPAYTAATGRIAAALSKQFATDTGGLSVLTDMRVNNKVNVVNVDVSALNSVISTDMTNFNGVLYIDDTTPDAGGYINTIRLRKGQVLPSNGLSVATPKPVYIEGDYNSGFSPLSNTATTSNGYGTNESKAVGTTVDKGSTPYTRVPASVLGDAVMLLSNNWVEANSNSANYTGRTATGTTFNVALMGGFMPSVWSNSTTNSYSGGAINYPRFLEGWSGVPCVYWGSMVELFPSKLFTQKWVMPATGSGYYYPPTRYYNFDPNYLKSSPPGSVAAIVLSRGPWTKF